MGCEGERGSVGLTLFVSEQATMLRSADDSEQYLQETAARLVANADADGDGSVSFEEFERVAARFEHLRRESVMKAWSTHAGVGGE